MAQQLTDMTIDEISLVDDGANEGAKVLIVKAKSKPPVNVDEELDPNEEENDNDADDKGMKKSAHSGQAASGGNPVNPDAADLAAASLKEFRMDIETLSKALEDAEAKLTALEKRASDAETALVDAEAVIKAKDAEIAEITKAAEPTGDDEIIKSLPESIRKRLEDADAAAKAAAEEVAKMKEQTETAEYIAKAKALGAGDADKLGGLLMRVAKGKTTEEDAATFETMLKAANAQGQVAALFKSVGSDSAVDGNPGDLLQAKADEIHKAADGKMTKEQAYAKAMDENPELYTAYVSKRRSA